MSLPYWPSHTHHMNTQTQSSVFCVLYVCYEGLVKEKISLYIIISQHISWAYQISMGLPLRDELIFRVSPVLEASADKRPPWACLHLIWSNVGRGNFMGNCVSLRQTLVQSPGIPTRLSLTFTLIAGRVHQALPNQNTESGDICHPLFHGIWHLIDLIKLYNCHYEYLFQD